MKLVEFSYKKADGSVSQRAVVELVQPSKHFEGIDVSNMSEPEFAEFVEAYRQVKNQQYLEVQELLAKHDLKHNYRRFLPEQMTDVISEHI
jgi:hypothetical protein